MGVPAPVAELFAENAEALLKLGMAAALGGVIGLEREASGKPAGFRTNLLICLGAALVTEISLAVARDVTLPGGLRADPARLAAQIVSGVGFLGAGTIIQSRGSVSGLTTAATLWVVAAIGIAVGAGAYVAALACTLLVMFALTLLGRFDDRLMPYRVSERSLRITLVPDAAIVGDIESRLHALGYQIRAIDVEKLPDALVVSVAVRGTGGSFDRALRALLDRDGVRQVTLQ